MTTGIALLVVSFFAFLQDIRMHKIKNWYILLTLTIGLVYQFLSGNAIAGILGAATGMLFYPLFMLRLMGAGDVKMFCVLGAWVAVPLAFRLIVCCVLVNGAVALVIMLLRKNGRAVFYNFWLWIKNCFFARGYIPMVDVVDQSDKYPYMIGVFLGVIVFCAIGG